MKQATAWNYNGLKKFKAGLSALRKRRDTRDLKKAFALADKSPAFREALEWAQAHGIEFIIDRKTQSRQILRGAHRRVCYTGGQLVR